MDFSLVHFNDDPDESFPTKTLVLSNELCEIEVTTSPMGLVVGFIDSYDNLYEWFEDGKEWINEEREVCEEPEEWDENFWPIVTKAEQFIDSLANKTFSMEESE